MIRWLNYKVDKKEGKSPLSYEETSLPDPSDFLQIWYVHASRKNVLHELEIHF